MNSVYGQISQEFRQVIRLISQKLQTLSTIKTGPQEINIYVQKGGYTITEWGKGEFVDLKINLREK